MALFALSAAPAGATTDETANPGNATGGVSQTGIEDVVTVEASTTFLPVGSEGSTGSGCTESSETTVYISDDFTTALTAGFYLTDPVNEASTIFNFTFSSASGHASQTRLFSPTGRWFRYNCGGDYYLLPEGGPVITIGGLVDRAIASINPPDPTLAVTPDHGKHAVNMPSWLAVEPSYWNTPRTAVVTSGRVRVEATLTPSEVSWDMGNGDIETCDLVIHGPDSRVAEVDRIEPDGTVTVIHRTVVDGGDYQVIRRPDEPNYHQTTTPPAATGAAGPARDEAVKAGDHVKAGDRGNVGLVLSIDEDTALVRFTNNQTSATKDVPLPITKLERIDPKQPTTKASGMPRNTGKPDPERLKHNQPKRQPKPNRPSAWQQQQRPKPRPPKPPKA